MKRYWFFRGLKYLVFGALFLLVFGGVTMLAWNHVMPHISYLKGITYTQAVALLLLARLLFWRGGYWQHRWGSHHGWGPGWHNPHFKKMMEERWQKMSPEMRERAKKYWEYRCGNWKDSGMPGEPTTEAETKTENAGQ